MENDECKCGHERNEHQDGRCTVTFPSEYEGEMWERCDCEGFELCPNGETADAQV
jgi:hypothetical protein